MDSKKLIIIVSLVIIGACAFVFFQKNRWYSMADVVKHANAASCLTVVGGSVYDVTALASSHTGGSKAILQVCGKDGTLIFNSRHGDDGDVKSVLENYRIGILHVIQ